MSIRPAEDRLLANVSAGKIETAFDEQVGFVLELLRDQFAENELLGEILGANNNAILAGGTTSSEQCD